MKIVNLNFRVETSLIGINMEKKHGETVIFFSKAYSKFINSVVFGEHV